MYIEELKIVKSPKILAITVGILAVITVVNTVVNFFFLSLLKAITIKAITKTETIGAIVIFIIVNIDLKVFVYFHSPETESIAPINAAITQIASIIIAYLKNLFELSFASSCILASGSFHKSFIKLVVAPASCFIFTCLIVSFTSLTVLFASFLISSVLIFFSSLFSSY